MEPIRSRMTLGQVIRTTFGMFIDHMLVLTAVGTVPLLPALGVLVWLGVTTMANPAWVAGLSEISRQSPGTPPDLGPLMQALPIGLLAAGALLMILGGVVSYVATIHVVCAACEGRRPSLGDALAAGIGAPALKMFPTGLLAAVAIGVTMLPGQLAIRMQLGGGVTFACALATWVLGMMLMMNLLFAPVVVVAEGKWALRALRRSVELAWGRCWRNFGVYLVMALLMMAMVLAMTVGMLFLPSGLVPDVVKGLVPMALQLGMMPVYMVLIVVLYYDMRARNGESFAPLPPSKPFPDPPKLQQDGHSFGALPPKSRMRVASRSGGTRQM